MNYNDIYLDALSLKLFGKNYNPHPSKAWFKMATEDETAEWQNGDREMEDLLMSRVKVQKKVDNFTLEMAEEDEGIRHRVPPLEENYDRLRLLDITNITLQQVKHRKTKCIFHNDSNPSCVLYPDGKGFYCFSCTKSGNAIDWTMEEFSLTFPQALEFLKNY